MRRHLALISLGFLVMMPVPAQAHGGGLDGLGCHHNRKAGGYHCHRGPLAGKSFATKEDAMRALRSGTSPRASKQIVGKARIVDGDTITVSGSKIDLFGIDAPDTGETCIARGKPWPCGQNATFALSAIVERQWVYCRPVATAPNKRLRAVCRLAGADGPDIAGAMVRQGWARAIGGGYAAEEQAARRAKAGLWVE